MMPQSALGKKKPATASGITIKNKPKVSEEQSRDIMNNLFSELDKKDNEELEDISSAAVVAELNKPIALNKQDQMYNKYNITLGGTAPVDESEKVMGPPATEKMQTSVNPFSKKRKFDEVALSSSNSESVAPPKSVNTTVFYDANDVSAEVYHSAKDDSRMEIDTSSAPAKQTPLKQSIDTPIKQSPAAEDWQKMKQA